MEYFKKKPKTREAYAEKEKDFMIQWKLTALEKYKKSLEKEDHSFESNHEENDCNDKDMLVNYGKKKESTEFELAPRFSFGPSFKREKLLKSKNK